MENKTKINVGFVIQVLEKDWFELEELVSKFGRVLYAKKVPSTFYLRISQEHKGEKNDEKASPMY